MADNPFDPVWLWGVLAASVSATFVWRVFGTAAANRISVEGPMARWVACVAYAVLAGLIARMVLLPAGVLAEAHLADRIGALALGFTAFFVFRRSLPAGLAVAVFAFMAAAALRAAV